MLRQGFDKVNALVRRVAKVLDGAYLIIIADQQAQHDGIAVHRLDGDGRKVVFTGPRFLAFQQTLRQSDFPVRGQHAAQPAI